MKTMTDKNALNPQMKVTTCLSVCVLRRILKTAWSAVKWSFLLVQERLYNFGARFFHPHKRNRPYNPLPPRKKRLEWCLHYRPFISNFGKNSTDWAQLFCKYTYWSWDLCIYATMKIRHPLKKKKNYIYLLIKFFIMNISFDLCYYYLYTWMEPPPTDLGLSW